MIVLMLAVGVGASPIKIGITQIVEHPALDAARQGFIDCLTDAGYGADKVIYDIQSAQGDRSIALTIADKFVADKVDLILAIATPTAQAVAKATATIPVLITAVTDPVAAEIVHSIEKPGTNVTGTSDLTPVARQLELLKRIAPEAKRVGVLYNAGEINSVVQVEVARQAAPEVGLTLVEATVSTTGEVLQAAQSLVGRVDAIYVPTDNTVVAGLESVMMVAEGNKLPLIVGEGDAVRRGGLATVGIDYYKLGYQTGKMALRILEDGENPAEMPIEYQEDINLIVNLDAAERMGVVLSPELLAEAEIVN
ncbi:MAG: ABC transporter substrate-binding protein [Firmicutes bacterium]|nr:ABC transporter substrate-binding protein [Bacillota bacterium]